MAKVPVIANRCPGIRETLPDDWPLFVDNNNVDDFCKIFMNLNAYNREKLSELAYNFVSNRFSIYRMQLGYEQVYEKLLESL